MADWTKGYESSTPESANAPNRPSDQKYLKPGAHAVEEKRRWINEPDTQETDLGGD